MAWIVLPGPPLTAEESAVMRSRAPASRAWWSAVTRLEILAEEGTTEDASAAERTEREAWKCAVKAHRRATRASGPARPGPALAPSPGHRYPAMRARSHHPTRRPGGSVEGYTPDDGGSSGRPGVTLMLATPDLADAREAARRLARLLVRQVFREGQS